jgi:sirohydrochlorin ferrochelatase
MHGRHAGPTHTPASAPSRSAPETTSDGLPVRRGHQPVRASSDIDDLPARQSTSHTLRPAGRHRRAVPASLPQGAPALVLAIPGPDSEHASSMVNEIATVLAIDNPMVDVRTAWIDGRRADPSSLRAVLDDASARRPAGAPCAVVVPLIAAPHPAIIRRIREAISASQVNASIGEFVNANPLLAEALHIRLAEAGLSRADRVRLFSIVTAADGIIVATTGGPEAVQSASITAVLLAARLALPVLTASIDGPPSLEDAIMRLKEMGATRIAVSPCFIGPELNASLDDLSVGVECARPIGAHGNVAKLVAAAYGQAINQLEMPG